MDNEVNNHEQPDDEQERAGRDGEQAKPCNDITEEEEKAHKRFITFLNREVRRQQDPRRHGKVGPKETRPV